jgi:hypothetical protein
MTRRTFVGDCELQSYVRRTNRKRRRFVSTDHIAMHIKSRQLFRVMK